MVTRDLQTSRWRPSGLFLFSGLVLALGTAAWGILSRVDAETALARATDEAALPTVATIVAQAGPIEEEVVLPGTVKAEYDTQIYARTSGYVKRWHVDIGARVKGGDLLAEIDSPEVDQQLAQARAQLVQMQASLAQAQSNMELAQVTNSRTTRLVGQGWSSQQQGDQDRLTLASSVAAVEVARANLEAQQAQVGRLEQLTGFERVVAPFDGIITSRQVDIGNLINAGSSTGAELFQIADMRKLRIYVQVPQSYARRSSLASTSRCAFRNIPAVPSRHVSSAAPMRSNHGPAPCWSSLRRTTRRANYCPAVTPRCISNCRSPAEACASPPMRCCFGPMARRSRRPIKTGTSPCTR